MDLEKNLIKKYYLRTGATLALVFPGIFVFDKAGNNLPDTVLQFFVFSFFILLLWIFNAIFVDFTPFLKSTTTGGIHQTAFKKVFISLFISVPLYVALALIFRQEHVLFQSLFEENFSFKAWFYLLLRIVLFDVGLLVIKYLIDNNREKQRFVLENEILKNEQLHATYTIFKQQVDPHFLFNSLNTLQSLVKQQDSDNSLKFIKELSNVYRYMLAQRDKDVVTLAEEMDFLRSYLYLLKIRFGNSFRDDIRIEEKYLNTAIPVHTLQLLAENIVKHNAVSSRQTLKFEIRSDQDCLYIKNNLLPKQHTGESSGIGLHNINKRYALLFGKEISIVQTDSDFTVLLPIINNNGNTDHRRRGPGCLDS